MNPPFFHLGRLPRPARAEGPRQRLQGTKRAFWVGHLGAAHGVCEVGGGGGVVGGVRDVYDLRHCCCCYWNGYE